MKLSEREDLTIEIIQNNSQKPWRWEVISDHQFELNKKEWINKKRLRHIKALQIQRHWRNCTCNPIFKLAKKLIIKNAYN